MNDANGGHFPIPVYLINLDRAHDRLAMMEGKLAKARLPFERVSAVDGRDITFPDPDFNESGYTWLHGRRRNPAEIGCYLSHIECARRLLASDAEYALILEDDLDFPEDLLQILHSAIRSGGDWNILRLSTVNRGRKYTFGKLTATRSLAIALTREKGSGAYLIDRRAARWFVEKLVPMRLPFDLAYDLEYLAGLRTAFVVPVPISQDIGLPTQIQGRRRAYHLSRWHYAIILPYRAWLETTRLLARSASLCGHLLRGKGRSEQLPSQGASVADVRADGDRDFGHLGPTGV